MVTILLMFALYLEIIGDMLPKSSTSIPALAQFSRVVMIESACALLATCFVLSLHFKVTGTGVKRMHRFLRLIFVECIAPVLCLWRVKESKEHEERVIDNTRACAQICSENNVIEVACVEDQKVTNVNGTKQLLNEVKTITAALRHEETEKEILREWQLLAMVFDRLFFLFFLITFIVSSCVILLSAIKD